MTVYSAATISAVFLLGLGVGSLVVWWIADCFYVRGSTWPLKMYGISELLIAALGLGVVLVLPNLEAFSASLSS